MAKRKPQEIDRTKCEHTKIPGKWEDYKVWRMWMIETCRLVRCPNCGDYKIWEKRE